MQHSVLFVDIDQLLISSIWHIRGCPVGISGPDRSFFIAHLVHIHLSLLGALKEKYLSSRFIGSEILCTEYICRGEENDVSDQNAKVSVQ